MNVSSVYDTITIIVGFLYIMNLHDVENFKKSRKMSQHAHSGNPRLGSNKLRLVLPPTLRLRFM